MLIRVSILTQVLFFIYHIGLGQTNQSPHLNVSIGEELLEQSKCLHENEKLRHFELDILNVDMEKVAGSRTTFKVEDKDQNVFGGYRVSGHKKVSGARLKRWLEEKEAYSSQYFLIVEVSLLFHTGLSIQVSERFCLAENE